MIPPPNENGGPRATGNRRSETNAHQTQVRAATVQPAPLSFERNRVPSAFASQFPPDGAGRGWWWIAYRCPHCEASHLGRARERIKDGLRRSRCGRRIWLVIARTYRTRRAA